MDLDATPFRAFLKISEHHSFTRAATELNISQPALSAMIKEFERRLGFALFVRTSRRVTLTSEGRLLTTNAKRVVLEHDWALQRAREIRSNDLRIAVPHSSALIAERVDLTDGFSTTFPKANLSIFPLGTSRIYDAIRLDDAEIALLLEPSVRTELSPISADFGSEFEAHVLATRKVGLVVGPGHPAYDCQSLHVSELRGVSVATIRRVHGGALPSSIMRFLTECGADILRTDEGDAISLMRFAMRNTVLAVDIGWFDMARVAVAPKLRRLRIDGAEIASDLVMLRTRREQRPMADRFWDYARGRHDAP